MPTNDDLKAAVADTKKAVEDAAARVIAHEGNSVPQEVIDDLASTKASADAISPDAP